MKVYNLLKGFCVFLLAVLATVALTAAIDVALYRRVKGDPVRTITCASAVKS